jgi:hypothetical protein
LQAFVIPQQNSFLCIALRCNAALCFRLKLHLNYDGLLYKYFLLTVRDEKFDFLLIPEDWNFSHPRYRLEITSHSVQGPRNVQRTDIRADGKNLTSANSGIDSEPNGPVLRATGFCPRMMIICTRRFSSGCISYHSLSYAALYTALLWNHALDMSFQNQVIYKNVRLCDINTSVLLFAIFSGSAAQRGLWPSRNTMFLDHT